MQLKLNLVSLRLTTISLIPSTYLKGRFSRGMIVNGCMSCRHIIAYIVW